MAQSKSTISKKKLTSTSIGSKTNGMSREEILRALKTQKPSDFYVWDGKSEDDKPLTPKEMADGLLAYKKRGRPFSASTKNKLRSDWIQKFWKLFKKRGLDGKHESTMR